MGVAFVVMVCWCVLAHVSGLAIWLCLGQRYSMGGARAWRGTLQQYARVRILIAQKALRGRRLNWVSTGICYKHVDGGPRVFTIL